MSTVAMFTAKKLKYGIYSAASTQIKLQFLPSKWRAKLFPNKVRISIQTGAAITPLSDDSQKGVVVVPNMPFRTTETIILVMTHNKI
jgi:hypothetical protein